MSQAFQCFPDIVFDLHDTVVKNRKNSSCITTQWTAQYTPMYELMMIAWISELKEAVGVNDLDELNKIFDKDIPVTLNLTELSNKLEKLNLSKQNDLDKPDGIRFKTGDFIKQKLKTYTIDISYESGEKDLFIGTFRN